MGLRDHIQGARRVARDLAVRHGVDLEPVDLGAAAHDAARSMKGAALLAEGRRYRLEVHPVEEMLPLLLHGAIAAHWLERDDGISDHRVLEAVRCHPTGKRGMGPVAKAVFLGDKLDPQKVKRYPYLRRVAALAEESLDRAILEYLDRQIVYLFKQGSLVHPESIELRDELMVALG